MNADNTGLFAEHLEYLLGTDPEQLDWPREFSVGGVTGELPAVYDHHNRLLSIYGALPVDFSMSDLNGCLVTEKDAVDLCSRLLVFAPAGAAAPWQALGFVCEGKITCYWGDGGVAELWARSSAERAANSPTVLAPEASKLATDRPLPSVWTCRPVDSSTPDDARKVRGLLQDVFPSYPIPEDPGAIRFAWVDGMVHGRLIADQAGAVAAYASAEFQTGGGSVEITDCATATAARGQGLMTHLVKKLLADLAEVFECHYAYALAREGQPAIQQVFAQCGWVRTGRLVNHFQVDRQWVSAWVWEAVPSPDHRQ